MPEGRLHAAREALILAAGVGSRLGAVTDGLPKCLLRVGGRSILDHQISALRSVGVRRLVLVTGYRREQVEEAADQLAPDLERVFVRNSRYAETNVLASWYLGSQYVSGDHYYLHSDTVFEQALMERLGAAAGMDDSGVLITVDRHPCGDEEMKVVLDGRRLRRITKRMDPSQADGEFTGVLLARHSLLSALRSRAAELLRDDGGARLFFEATLQSLIDDGIGAVGWVDVTGVRWREIDYPEDLEMARSLFEASG